MLVGQAPSRHRSNRAASKSDDSLTRDRGFESISLQRREPDFRAEWRQPDAVKIASYGTGLLSIGTILGCMGQERAHPPIPSTPRSQMTDPCNKAVVRRKSYRRNKDQCHTAHGHIHCSAVQQEAASQRQRGSICVGDECREIIGQRYQGTSAHATYYKREKGLFDNIVRKQYVRARVVYGAD